jgi:hypothetical protein
MAWGTNMKYRGIENGDGFFFKQHETALLRDGSIAVFNNNMARDNPDKADHHHSSVVIFTQPTDSINSRVIWKYECQFDSINIASHRGGGVDELKNGNLLVCMGTVNRIFEVTRDKRIVWSSIIEQRDQQDSIWVPVVLYRAHYTSSLYPCYFTTQTNLDTLNKKSASFQLRIFNDGTEDDSYQVSISSASGCYQKHFSTAILPGSRSVRFEIAPDKVPTTNDKIEISVKSKTNPDFKRITYLPYSK